MSLTILLIESGTLGQSTARVEIPGWSLDDVQLDDLGIGPADAYVAIANRDPEVDETGVRVSTHIEFDVFTDAGDAPLTTDLVVTVAVNGGSPVVAYDGGSGGFQAGWDGPDSSLSFVDAYTLHVVIDQAATFASLAVVDVSISGNTTNAQAYSSDYTFTIEDATAPVLAAASGVDKDVVRVTFDEAVNQTAAGNADSSLNPANYMFTRLTASDDPTVDVASVPIVATSVAVVSASVVDVTLDWEMTAGVEYTLTVTGIEDVFGNPIAAPDNVATFTGFVPERPGDRDFDLYTMLAQTTRDLDDVSRDLFRTVSVFSEICGLLLCLIDRWTDIIDPDKAPELFVDAILCDLGNPFQFDLTLTEKRKLVRILVPIYKQKGTGVGLINAVRFFLGIEVTINALNTEGWDLGIDELGDELNDGTAILGPGTLAARYSFEIISPVVLTADQRSQIIDIANYMKPAGTHLAAIVEPTVPEVFDHLELGESELGGTTEGTFILH